MPRGKFQHFCRDHWPGVRGTGNATLGQDEIECIHGNWLEDSTNQMHASLRADRADHSLPVERHVDGDEEQIETAGNLADFLFATTVDHMMRAQVSGLIGLGLRRCEGRDVAPPRLGKLKAQVS